MVCWVPYLNMSDFYKVTRIVALFCPRRLFESDLNNCPSPSHSNLVSDEVYICSGLLLMVSWLLPYLAKGPTPDFNNGPGNDSNIGCILAIQRLFESNVNNSPSLRSNLVSGRVYICSGFLLTVFWRVPYLPSLTSVMVWEVTQIVAPFPPWRLFESDSNNGSPGLLQSCVR